MSAPRRPSEFGAYLVGFLLSLALTGGAYALAAAGPLRGGALTAGLVGLGLVQLLVQLVCFLHLGRSPRANAVVLLFMAVVVLILVAGSLWIMDNLNYGMLTPAETNAFIVKDEGISK